MHARSLLCLSATLAFTLSSGAAFANPSHGGAHPTPKAHAPAKKNNGHANPPSTAATHKNGTSPNTNPSTASNHKNGANPSTGTHQPGHKDEAAHQKKDEHRQRDGREEHLERDIDRLAKLDAQLARALLAQKREHHHHEGMKNQNGNGNNPNQQGSGQQGYQSGMGSGQQGSGQQGSGSTGGYGSTGDEGSAGAQVANEPGNSEHHGMAGDALQHVERLLMAAIHQLEEAFGGDEHHRRHHLAEANRLLDEAARRGEMAAHAEARYEHPHLEAAPHSPRS